MGTILAENYFTLGARGFLTVGFATSTFVIAGAAFTFFLLADFFSTAVLVALAGTGAVIFAILCGRLVGVGLASSVTGILSTIGWTTTTGSSTMG
jgi:hypothetical protein